jgi:DNA modification methylase
MCDPPNVVDALSQDLTQQLFPTERRLVPYLDDVYELELAFYENQLLADEELIRNAGYFASIGDTYTRHFLMCTGESLKLPDYSSSRLKSFFQKNQFRTGYATHGLFPYRGKFHPQMIKGIINVMGLKPGDIVLDPMMGSGTVLVEACLMGIRSIGVDASPFCRFMTQTKIDALTMSLSRSRKALSNYEEVFAYFQKQVGKPARGTKTRKNLKSKGFMSIMEPAAEYVTKKNRDQLTDKRRETSDTYNFLLLAYLDSAGYSERSGRKSPLDQFKAILERYLFVAEKIQDVLKGVDSDIAHADALEGDARALFLEDQSVDGIIFSPPYSFAIDYLKNDSFHLNFLGVETDKLREDMVGLRGRGLSEKFEIYQEDMDKVVSECARVLRPGRLCTIIVGTNNNQLGKALNVHPEEVTGLHEILVDIGSKYGLQMVKMMSRPITGISNTMRREYIVMLRRS